ncbi:CD9 antigen-like [Limulus polyphemus]|uniref:Tetraspanin n=1 Tax=Limulus polyphemus TaxID=6850 RepID=A0ABM1BPP3_LIMPO|nr:CD9 antigen-like [Limulus polyphemus]
MALNGCYNCLKYLVIVFNLLFWLAGIGVLVVAVWLYLGSHEYLTNNESTYIYFTAIYILMAAGSLMSLVGFLGCCGALRESPCMLGTFFVFLLVIFLAELTGGIWGWLHRDKINKMIDTSITRMIKEEYPDVNLSLKSVDALQHDLHCCGAKGPDDWAESGYNKKKSEKSSILSFISPDSPMYKVPSSCCSNIESENCGELQAVIGLSSANPKIHQKGCVQALQKQLEEHLTIIIGVGIGLGIIQLLGLVFSMALCCAIRN